MYICTYVYVCIYIYIYIQKVWKNLVVHPIQVIVCFL